MPLIEHRHEILFTGSNDDTVAEDRRLRRACGRGELVRLRRGAYLSAQTWATCTPEQRHRLRVVALLDGRRGAAVACHASAAALWGIPQPESAADEVHLLTSSSDGGRFEHGIRLHAVADVGQHVVDVDGLLRTTLERTVVDIALTRPFADAVVAADWALRLGSSRGALCAALDEFDPRRGRPRVERVLAFADGRSGSVGESLSRVAMHELGFPAPELQLPLRDRRGFIGFGDFAWEALRLVGEFDGRVKYVDARMLRGRSVSAVVVEEKRREDRIRATGRGVVRWTWADVLPGGSLGQILLGAGLRPDRARVRRVVSDTSGWRAMS